MARTPSSRPPLDAAAIERLALRYVERFATTRVRFARYLSRKMAERGTVGDVPDPMALAERFAELGYIDDRRFGEARAEAMGRRGLGARRVSAALHHAGLAPEDRDPIVEGSGDHAMEHALAFARRRRIGPFAENMADPALRQRQLAAMIRAGHSYDLARKIVQAQPGEVPSEYDTRS